MVYGSGSENKHEYRMLPNIYKETRFLEWGHQEFFFPSREIIPFFPAVDRRHLMKQESFGFLTGESDAQPGRRKGISLRRSWDSQPRLIRWLLWCWPQRFLGPPTMEPKPQMAPLCRGSSALISGAGTGGRVLCCVGLAGLFQEAARVCSELIPEAVLISQGCCNTVPPTYLSIFSHSCGREFKIKGSAGLCSLWGLQGRLLPCLFQLSMLPSNARHPVAWSCLTPISASVVMWPPLVCVPLTSHGFLIRSSPWI